ncbi:MAG: SCE4755 family polysaccharide monooxygenase-like protein [Bdellovibrionales bacterium]
MNQRNLVFGFILIVLVLLSHASFAHSIFDPNGNIPGRTTAVQKVGPCGNIARTATNKVIAAGSKVRVDWLETIQHPGRYEFYLSTANDANFVMIGSVPDNQDDQNVPHVFNTMLQFPAGVTCANCTLQMIQVMTENPAAPTNYYSCADISLQSGVINPPAPLPPTPAPATGPTNCH